MKTTNDKPTRIRFRMLALVFVSVVINYMDRSNLSVAASAITEDLQLTSIQLGLLFAAFGWSYAALQIPGGILVDRFGPRIMYTFTLITWSLVTLLQGLMKGFAGLFGLRLLLGAFEAPTYPTNNRIVTSWFPESERASAIAIYTSGQFLGLAFLTPALVSLEYYTGWQGLFIVTGSVGIIWAVVWYFFYRDPLVHKQVNELELEYIETGGGKINRITGSAPKQGFRWSDLREVLSHKKLWGIYLGQFAVNSTLWFFLTWFPTYLVKYRGLSYIKSGFLASVPFLAAFAGLLLSGFLSDGLLKKGVSPGVARKSPVIIGLLLSMSIIGANYVDSPALIILFMSVAFFGNGFASITWVFVSALAPKHLIGLTGGVFNFIGGLALIIPIAIGYLVHDGDFTPALILIGTIAFTGACSYIFLVGKVENIEIKHAA
jgi:ACS family D-galactonate transporter-like MFS transporter